MSALFMDGFDQYGSGAAGIANMLDGVWASLSGNDFTIGQPSWGASRTGLNCLAVKHSSNQDYLTYVVPGAPAKMFVSFGFAIDQLPPVPLPIIFETRNSSNQVQYNIRLMPTGAINLYDSTGTLVAGTAGPVVRSRTWHFFELMVDYTGGVFSLRVDDADASQSPILTHSIATGLTNAIIAFGQLGLFSDFGSYHYWDDLFIRDSNGTVNNTWLGDRRVATLFANADQPAAGWTPNYYEKFGAGVLQNAYMVPNNSTPQSYNACVTASASSSLDIGNSAFTLESFVRFERLPDPTSYSVLFNRWDVSSNARSYRLMLGGTSYNNGCLQFDYSTDGTSSTISTPIIYPWTPNLDQWYHIALVRTGGQLLLFIDGKQMGLPIANTATYYSGGVEGFVIGAEAGAGGVVNNTHVIGMFDETRFTNGVGRYNTAFTPTTTAFPRGAGFDTNWAQVALLCGYDSGIIDESSYSRTLFPNNGAVSYLPNDGPAVGVYSTINKATPDDNTFISASLTNATDILTMTTQPSNGNTVTVGTKTGPSAAVYTFKTALASAFDVLIDTTAQNTLLNLIAAINAGAGAGTKYGTGTTSNLDVTASQLPAGQMLVTANTAGTVGNSIAASATGTAPTWATATLTGGANIPSYSEFKLARPPSNTTIISAIQQNVRAFKSDSGTSTIQTSLIGPLGGVTNGSTHPLAISPDYYYDIIEKDPDTAASITPATLINGKIRINRTA